MCDWPVYSIYGGIDTARMCAKNPIYEVGPLGVCGQHWDVLVRGIMDVARTRDHVAEEMRHSMRIMEVGRRAAEREAQEEMYATQGRPSQVYFVERGGYVKIGKTVDITERLRVLSGGGNMVAGMTVGPVTLLATMPGGVKEEKQLHRRFRSLRVDPNREWFHYEGALRRYIESLAQPEHRVQQGSGNFSGAEPPRRHLSS